jgi:hypothetical protein
MGGCCWLVGASFCAPPPPSSMPQHWFCFEGYRGGGIATDAMVAPHPSSLPFPRHTHRPR